MGDNNLITPEQLMQLVKAFSGDECLQRIFLKQCFADLLREEMVDRQMPPPMLTLEQLAERFNTTPDGIRSMMKGRRFNIPYVRQGKGGRLLFDSRDVEAAINKMKVYPIVRPESLRRAKSR